jgi:beta-xylosidase
MKKNLLAILFLSAFAFAHVRMEFTNPIFSGFYPDPSICRAGSDLVIQLFKSTNSRTADGSLELIASSKIPGQLAKKSLFLKIESDKDKYSFSYSFSPGRWAVLKADLDGTFLSTKTAGGFVGSVYAIYATSLGRPSSSTASFDWFEYEGKDARE